MWLANESCVHNCGRYILSSVLDMGQHTNIKQVEEFCLKMLLSQSLRIFVICGVIFVNLQIKSRQAEACPTAPSCFIVLTLRLKR
jgi:hypothetical protein